MSSMVPSPFSRLADGAISGLLSGIAQTIAGVKTFTALLVASAGIQVASLFNTNGTGASDVVVKVGTSTADGSVNANATLLSARTGVGGTEIEYFRVRKGGVFVPIVTVDSKSGTNVPGIVIMGNGSGETGLGFEGTHAQGGCDLGLGSALTLGFALRSTNRTQSFIVNNDAFSGSAVAAFSFLASESAGLKAKDLMRVEGASDRTGNLLNLRRGTTSEFSVGAGGGVTALGNLTAATLYTTNNTIGDSGGAPRITFPGGGSVLSIRGSNGAGASDVAVRVGPDLADGSVNASAKLFSIGTGLGGTFVEYAFFQKDATELLGAQAIKFRTRLASGNANGVYFTRGGGAGGAALLGYGAGGYLLVDGSLEVRAETNANLLNATGTGGGALLFGLAGTGVATFTNYLTRQSAPLALYANGTTGITETVRLVGQRGDSGLKCVVAGTENASPNAAAVLFQTAKGVSVTANNDAGNGTPTGLQVMGDGHTKARATLALNEDGVAKPAAGEAYRGTLWYSKSAGGVADTVEICLKSAADSYSWVVIATG